MPGRLEHSQHVSSSPDAASSPLPHSRSWCACLARRDVPMHTVVILQTTKITLHTSQKLARSWAQCIGGCREEKSTWIFFFLQPHGWKPSDLRADFSPASLEVGWYLLPAGMRFPGIYSPRALVSCESSEKAGPFLSCCRRCAGVSPPQQVPQVVELH